MEDEVTKHTKKIYNTLKEHDKSFWVKLKEVAIEIFIIVFAVTLSIWLHNWSDHRNEQRTTREFLSGLKVDLANDILLLKENRNTIAKVDSNFIFILELKNSSQANTIGDELIAQHLGFDLRTTHANVGRYEGFKSSGKMGTIENDSLKQNILVYYQQTIPGLDDIETMVNSLQTRVLDMEVDKNDKMSMKELIYSFKMRALLQLGTQNLDGQIKSYDDALQQAGHLISMIDQQLRQD